MCSLAPAALLAMLLFARTPPIVGADILTLDVVSATDENPRHDHQLIFPLRDGRLLLVWSEYYRTSTTKPGAQRDDMPCRLAAMVSHDRGRTWGERRVLQQNTGKLNIKHPNLLRLPDGDVLLFYTEWNSMEDRTVFMRRSTDDCQSWGTPLRVSALPGINNINNDHVLRLKSGRIVLPSFNSPIYGRGDHWNAFCYFSDDAGRTWRHSENRIDLPKRGAEEPCIVERNDGSLAAFLRTSLGTIYRAESNDAGVTWSPAVSTGLTAPASPTVVRRIPKTGDLLAVWNHNYEPDHHHQGERTPLAAAISRDDGITWSQPRHVENVPGGAAAYAAVFFQGDEAIISYYYQKEGMGGASGLRLKIIPLSWFYLSTLVGSE